MIQLKSLLTEQFGRVDSELILATTLVLEAGNEGPNGMDAVAHVILNRAKEDHNGWGTTPVQQVLRPYQFSMWNNYTKGREKWTDVLKRARSREDQWDYAFPLAKQLYNKSLSSKDATAGATFYYNPTTADPDSLGFTKDSKYIQTTKIGKHVFGKYKSIEKTPEKKSSTSSSSNKIYVVKSGETLGGIANRNGTTVANLKKLNKLTSDMIQPGQKLKIK